MRHGLRYAGIAAMIAIPGMLGFSPAKHVPPTLRALSADSASRVLAAESRLWVEGGSTVRSWSCETSTFNGMVRLSQGGLALSRLADAVQAVDLRIPAGALDCGNGTMNDHMWKALETDDHPQIRFQMERYSVGADSSVELHGRLTIAGETRPLTMVLAVTEVEGGRLRVEGSTEFPMTDFGVRPPRLMLGTLRVHDPVVVSFELVLEAQGAVR